MLHLEDLKNKQDYIGIASASLCVIHCLFTPVLILIASNFSWWHEVAYFFLLISFISAFQANKPSSSKTALWFIWSSLILLTLSIIFEDYHHSLHKLGYVASLGLIIGHIINIRYCNKCNHE
ncbi:MerC domain-containing protein [uncultured Arcticibacterium sp.]|uniref:MerC domain-containing protein n=1 Tax=uncultured Arcticibacterium sp. TaxID=2173042 RepID=UPI0030FADCBF